MTILSQPLMQIHEIDVSPGFESQVTIFYIFLSQITMYLATSMVLFLHEASKPVFIQHKSYLSVGLSCNKYGSKGRGKIKASEMLVAPRISEYFGLL